MTMNDRPAAAMSDRWRLWTLLIWLGFVVGMLWWYWARVQWFALGDTDDNMRIMQVRAWLAGQDWYDLRQYRLSPPQGFNIHWSRLVDLPIAGIILTLKPFFGTAIAERAAIGFAPLIPLGVTLGALGLACRRLIAPWAFALVPLLLLIGAGSTMGMFSPARIDHHGWQLAMIAVIVAGLADPRGVRGGITVGVGSALSLVIGFEMMPYLALAGVAIVLRWIWQGEETPRLRSYALALGGGSALGFLLFASSDNWRPVCDVLSPPWASTMVMAGGLLFVIGRLERASVRIRLVAATAVAVALAALFVLIWPQCLGRPEGVSPELQREWLNNIREARPIMTQEWRTALLLIGLSATGLVGSAMALWRTRDDRERLAGWASITLLSLCGFALLFFQIRAAAAAQMLAVPAAIALIWTAVPWLRRSPSLLVRVFGISLLVLGGSGALLPIALRFFPKPPDKPAYAAVRKAGAMCSTIPSMAPLDQLPATTIFTMVDLGPRLITLTHHNAIAGPYHRNGTQILDVHHAFEGNDAEARTIMRKYGATLLLICPKFAESTVYRAKSPKGFYARLEKGQVPAWLTPVALPANSPFKLWRINR